MNDDNRNVVEKFSNDKRAKVIAAEIGVWTGFFSQRILSCKNVDLLYLIDPWIFNPQIARASIPSRAYGLNANIGTTSRGTSRLKLPSRLVITISILFTLMVAIFMNISKKI